MAGPPPLSAREFTRAQQFWNEDVTALLRVGTGFDLSNVDPNTTPGTTANKKAAQAELAAFLRRGTRPG